MKKKDTNLGELQGEEGLSERGKSENERLGRKRSLNSFCY